MIKGSVFLALSFRKGKIIWWKKKSNIVYRFPPKCISIWLSFYTHFWVTWPPILTIMCSWADITWHQNEKSTILMTKQKILAVHFVPKMPKHGSIHAGLSRCWNKIRVKLASKMSFFPLPEGAENGLKKRVLVPWSQYYTFAPHIFWWNESVWLVCS